MSLSSRTKILLFKYPQEEEQFSPPSHPTLFLLSNVHEGPEFFFSLHSREDYAPQKIFTRNNNSDDETNGLLMYEETRSVIDLYSRFIAVVPLRSAKYLEAFEASH